MATLISIIAYLAAIFWLANNDIGALWWTMVTLLASAALTILAVRIGVPAEARISLRAFDSFASPLARSLMLPMAALHIALIALLVYAYGFR